MIPALPATAQHRCLRVGEYRDLTCYATQIEFISRGLAVDYCGFVKFFRVCGYCIDYFLRRYNRHGSRMPRTIFRANVNIPGIERSVNAVPSSTSRAKLQNKPTLERPWRSPMREKRVTSSWTDTNSQFAVRSGCYSVNFIGFLHAGSGKSLFTEFRLAPMSISLAR